MKYLAIILMVVFAGCAGVLSPKAQKVLVVSEKPQDCIALGKISASATDTSGAMSDSAMRQRAEDDLRTKAAKLGGDVAYILGAEKRWDYLLGGYEYEINGEIYNCVKSSVDSADLVLDSAKNVDFGAESRDNQNNLHDKSAESRDFVE